MEARPSHGATEGALGGRGKKREMFHPVRTRLTSTNAFGDLFKGIVL